MSRNSNGTYDLGIMQLNTINLKGIQRRFPKITAEDLVYKPCVNIYVGTWFLSEEIRRAKGNVIKGIGNYHSRTPKYHNKYVKRFYTFFDIVAKDLKAKYNVSKEMALNSINEFRIFGN